MKKQGKGFDPDEMEGDLYVIPASGGDPKRITNTPENEMKMPWTPDGKRITFEIHGEPWVASVDGGNPRKLKRVISVKLVNRMDSPISHLEITVNCFKSSLTVQHF